MQSRSQFYTILFATIFLSGVLGQQSSMSVHSVMSALFQDKNVTAWQVAQTTESNGQGNHFEEISQVLGTIETGRATLELIEQLGVDLQFEPGKGSCFYPHRNQIVIDSKFERYQAALVLIHEVTHARYFHEGLTAVVTNPDQQAYVQQKVEEEIDAMVAGVEATMELAEAGVDVVDIRPALYYPYRQAYGSAIRAAKYESPGLSETTLQDIGREAGRSAVETAVLDGTVVTSVSQQTYLEYWGTVWDGQQEQLSDATSA